jgi:predicted metal-dependent phosphoesterase TrpH
MRSNKKINLEQKEEIRMDEIRFDLHVHSYYSRDCKSKPENIIKEAKLRGLRGLAITDHNSIEFHKKGHSDSQLIILPGVEVSTKSGHIIGLGIKEPIQKYLSVEETVERINDLGGCAIASHPFDFTRKGIGKKIYGLKEIAVETMNGSSPFRRFNVKAQKWAQKANLPETGGSDSHRIKDIGMAYTILDQEITSVDELIELIRKRKTKSGGTNLSLPEKFIRAFQIHF